MILEPESLVRCLAFVGPMLACGDFGGSIHTWELEIASQPENTKKNPTFKVYNMNRRIIIQVSRATYNLLQLN